MAWPSFRERNSIYHLFTKFFAGTSFVGIRSGRIDGFILGFVSQSDGRIGYVHLVAVEPTAQRSGIATKLYGRLVAEFRRRGCRSVRCIINPDNSKSLSLHTGIGFSTRFSGPRRRVARVWATRDYNGPGIDMVEMEMRL